MKQFKQIGKKQSGFTLVEIIVVLAIIGIFSAVLFKSFSGDSSKVTALQVKSNEIRDAVLLYNTKTGCMPNRLDVLFNKSLAIAANNFCGQDTTANYGTSDYIAPLQPSTPGASVNGLDMGQTGLSGSYISIGKDVGGINDYGLKIAGLSAESQTGLMGLCNGVDYSTGATMPTGAAIATNRCVANGASEVDMMITKY
jgi:prepilin-type N-terminal cleavage/methylation domain-containing protein